MPGSAAAPHGSRPSSGPAQRQLLMVGAAGPLGAAVLERLLGDGGYRRVATLVTQPLAVALRGFEAWPVGGLAAPPVALPWRPDTAVVVVDRTRARSRREAAFFRPAPEQLPALAAWLQAAGAARLLLVLPQTPALLPQALHGGLASLDEQAVVSLDFEQLVLVRPARTAGHAADGEAPRGLHRLAGALLAQLHWMVPQRQQPLRAARVAAFVAELARALPAMPAGTRVAPAELVWDWAQPGGGDAVLQAWLHRRAPPPVAQPRRRW